ncbi:hypothetical protein [Daejeonella sp.]|uniref:hypothetical protein n=1 Tax=Daejeonella sp. TaxID=2805397 RepID=UPI0025C5548E|nr:hypothetical protein [Daejeonella sp.]
MVSRPDKKICPVCGVVMDPVSMEQHLNKRHGHKIDSLQPTLSFPEDKYQDIHVVWADIWFEKDKLIFKNSKYSLKPTTLKGVHSGLNTIREDYFLRVYKGKAYRLCHAKGVVNQEFSRGWKKLTEAITIAIHRYEFKTSSNSKIGVTIAREQISDFFNVSQEKEPFIKYLASLQDPQFPIIPILEVNSIGREESIIFRFLTKKDSVVVVWENIKQGRASHLSLTTIENLPAVIAEIEALILTNIQRKRSILHGGYTNSSTVKNRVSYLDNLQHKTVDSYKERIQYIIDCY